MYISETRTVSTAEKEWGKIVKTHPLYCKQLLSMEFNSLLYTVQQILRSSPSGAQITADLTATLFGAYFSISIVHLISFAKEMQYMFPLSQHISCTASTVVQYSTLLCTQYNTVHYCTPSTVQYTTVHLVQYTTVHQVQSSTLLYTVHPALLLHSQSQASDGKTRIFGKQ